MPEHAVPSVRTGIGVNTAFEYEAGGTYGRCVVAGLMTDEERESLARALGGSAVFNPDYVGLPRVAPEKHYLTVIEPVHRAPSQDRTVSDVVKAFARTVAD